MYCSNLLVLSIAGLRFLAIYITARADSTTLSAGIKNTWTATFTELLVIFGTFYTITVCQKFTISCACSN
jgi:hypothetical protein